MRAFNRHSIKRSIHFELIEHDNGVLVRYDYDDDGGRLSFKQLSHKRVENIFAIFIKHSRISKTFDAHTFSYINHAMPCH